MSLDDVIEFGFKRVPTKPVSTGVIAAEISAVARRAFPNIKACGFCTRKLTAVCDDITVYCKGITTAAYIAANTIAIAVKDGKAVVVIAQAEFFSVARIAAVAAAVGYYGIDAIGNFPTGFAAVVVSV